MPLPKFTRFIAVRLRARPSVTEGLGDSDVLRIGAGTWIDNFIRALNVASAMGGSFPPLKVATETLNVVLKDLRVWDPSVCFVRHRLFISITIGSVQQHSKPPRFSNRDYRATEYAERLGSVAWWNGEQGWRFDGVYWQFQSVRVMTEMILRAVLANRHVVY